MRNQPVDISDLRIRRYTVEKYSSELSADQDLGLVGKDLFISGNVIKPGEAF